LAERAGEPWTQDIFSKKNVPNSTYADARERKEARQAATALIKFLLPPEA
jgi:hypothetical protein